MTRNNSEKPNEEALGSNGVVQPLVSTGTTESGFDWDTDGSKLAVKPKIGDASLGDDGLAPKR